MVQFIASLIELLGMVGLSTLIATPIMATDESDYALLRYVASPESGGYYSDSYAIKISSEGRVYALETFGEKETPRKKVKFAKVIEIFHEQKFSDIPSDLTLQSSHCETIELHGSNYVVELKTSGLKHRVELDTGCEGFKQEDNLAKIIRRLEKILKLDK